VNKISSPITRLLIKFPSGVYSLIFTGFKGSREEAEAHEATRPRGGPELYQAPET